MFWISWFKWDRGNNKRKGLGSPPGKKSFFLVFLPGVEVQRNGRWVSLVTLVVGAFYVLSELFFPFFRRFVLLGPSNHPLDVLELSSDFLHEIAKWSLYSVDFGNEIIGLDSESFQSPSLILFRLLAVLRVGSRTIGNVGHLVVLIAVPQVLHVCCLINIYYILKCMQSRI